MELVTLKSPKSGSTQLPSHLLKKMMLIVLYMIMYRGKSQTFLNKQRKV